MKDFDTLREEAALQERTFKIGGETFAYWLNVRPEDVLPWFRMRSGESAGKLTQDEMVGIYDKTITCFLVPGQEEKWAEVRESADPPVSLSDMVDVIDWLFEEQAARPTLPPSDSSTGSDDGGTGTPSTDDSSSPAEKASTA